MVRRVRMSLTRVRVAIAVHALGVLLASNARGQSLLIRGGTLIDGTGRQPIENATVLIRDGVFAEIIPQAAAPTGNIDTIDARGKFLIPGLVDSHIHYRDWETELFLAHGVTSVNDIGNPYYRPKSGSSFVTAIAMCSAFSDSSSGPAARSTPAPIRRRRRPPV
jgi:hypothetical protein